MAKKSRKIWQVFIRATEEGTVRRIPNEYVARLPELLKRPQY
jgi:hypothetical protein